MAFVLLMLCALACTRDALGWQTPTSYDKESECQKIDVPMCRTNSSKYDQTRLPNFIGFTNQSQVQAFTKQVEMEELVKTKCSKDLVFFLCSVLLPICVSNWKGTNAEVRPMVPPCRSLCESVYNDCIQAITKLQFSWPGMLNCSELPNHDEGICITPDAFVTPITASCEKSRGSRSRARKKPLTLRALKRYDYVFSGRRSRTNIFKVLSNSTCTSKKLPQMNQLLLDQSSCPKKLRKSDGEVLILAKKGQKQREMTIVKIYYNASKDVMNTAIQKHRCNSRRKNGRRQSQSHHG